MKKNLFSKPFLIAEISANHNGSLKHAKKLIKCAKQNGADAVKLQTYDADMMTIKSNKKYFKIKNGIWKGQSLWNLYNKAKTPLAWHKSLFDYAKKLKILCFSTPFDLEAVDFLEKLNCPIYKIASFEMNYLQLIKKVAKTRKPMIISTGLASLSEIEKTLKVAKKYGAKNITLLYCVSQYPSSLDDFNLYNIEIMRKKFKCNIGLSDHSIDNRVMIASIANGVNVIEKHIALDNQKKGFDIKFALKGKEIKNFKSEMDKIFNLMGEKKFKRSNKEIKNLIFRRSIFATKNIKKGEKFNNKNIKIVRPNIGYQPEMFEKLLNKKAKNNFFIGDPIK